MGVHMPPATPGATGQPPPIWSRLTDPHPSITDPVRRGQTQLLASFQLITVLMGLGVLTFGAVVVRIDPTRLPNFRLAFLSIPPACLGLLLAYWLTRRGRYAPGAALFLAIWIAMILLIGEFGPTHSAVFYTVIPLLIGSLLLKPRQTALLALGLVALQTGLWITHPRAVQINSLQAFIYLAFVGPIVFIVAVYRNRMEQERLAALRHDDERLRWLAGAAFEGIVVTDGGRVIEINDRLPEWFGYTRAEMLGRPVADFVAPEHREMVAQRIASRDETPYEHLALRKDGSAFPVEVVSKMMASGERQVRVTAIRDISERQRTEQTRAVIFNISQAAIEATSLDAFLGRVRDELGTLIDVTNLYIALYDPATDLYSYPFWRDERDTDFAPQRLPGTLTDYVRRTGQPVLADDPLRQKLIAEQGLGRPVGPISLIWLGVPLKIEQQAIGVVVVQSYTRADLYTEADLDLLMRVSGDIALAIERKRAAGALQEARRFLQLVVDTVPSMIFVVDDQGRAVFVNQYTAQYYGTTPEELISKPTEAVHHQPTEATQFISDDQEVVRTRQKIVREEANTAPNGEQHWFHTVKVPLVRPDGTVEVLGISTDITERKRTELALQRSQQQYESLVNSVEGIVWEADAETFRFTFVSQQAERLLGYPVGRWLDEPTFWQDQIHPEDREWALNYCLDRSKEVGEYTFEYRMIAADERIVWIRDVVSVIARPGQSNALIGIMIDITDQKAAEARLKQQSAYLEALHETGLAVIERLEIDAALQSILEQATRLVGAQFGFLDLVTPQEDAIAVRLATGRDMEYASRRFQRGEGLAGKVWESGQPMLVDDYITWKGRSTKYPNTARAALAAPLTSGGKVVGVIGAGHVEEGKRFTQADLDVLGRFAELASIALDNARLYEAEREQRALSDALQAVAAALNSSLDVDEVLDLILSNVGQVVRHDAANVMFIEGPVAQIARARGYDEFGMAGVVIGTTLDYERLPLMKRLVESGQPALVPDVDAEPQYIRQPKAPLVRGFLGIPIRVEGQVIGILNLDSVTPGRFSEADIGRLQAFADHAAIAIRNAQLYEAEREQRAMAEALQAVAAALNRTLNLDEVLDFILDSVRPLVDCDTANVMLIEGRVGRVVRGQGYEERDWQIIQTLRLDIDRLPNLRRLVETGQSSLVADTRTDPEWVVVSEASAWLRAAASVPIRYEGQVIGIISLDSRTPDRFSARDLARLQAFADHAAIAVRNAQLYEAEREQRALAEALQAIAEALNRSLRLDEVLDLILDNIGRLVEHDSASIMLIEGDRARLARWKGYQGHAPDHRLAAIEINVADFPPRGRLVASGEPFLVDDTDAEPGLPRC